MDPEINFGLFKSFSSTKQTLYIENTSLIDAEMEFYLLSELNKPKDEESEEKVDYDEYLWENAYDIDIEREKPAIVKFIPRSLLLEPGEKGVV